MGVCCWVYNRMLEGRVKAYRRRKENVTYNQQQTLLTIWRSRMESLRAVPCAFERDALRRVDRGMKAFFRRLSHGMQFVSHLLPPSNLSGDTLPRDCPAARNSRAHSASARLIRRYGRRSRRNSGSLRGTCLPSPYLAIAFAVAFSVSSASAAECLIHPLEALSTSISDTYLQEEIGWRSGRVEDANAAFPVKETSEIYDVICGSHNFKYKAIYPCCQETI